MHDEVGTLVRHKIRLLINWESILPHLLPEPEASIVLKEEVNNLWARFGNRLWDPVNEYKPCHQKVISHVSILMIVECLPKRSTGVLNRSNFRCTSKHKFHLCFHCTCSLTHFAELCVFWLWPMGNIGFDNQFSFKLI